MTILLLLILSSLALASNPADPNSVLVIVQDNTGPETGTGGANAGQYVADYYMSVRGIPAGNIVHISTCMENGAGGCCSPGGTCSMTNSTSTNISYQSYLDNIQAPIVAKLATGSLASTIKYIVPTYGVPVTIISRTVASTTYTGLSIDNAIAAINQNIFTGFYSVNPYWAQAGFGSPASTPEHLVDLNLTPRWYAVSRLDGTSAAIAKGLVDKAILGETAGVNIRGNGYFDWQGIGSSTSSGTANQRTDATMLSAYSLCAARTNFACIVNNQTTSGHAITAYTGMQWMWGWYYEPTALTSISILPGAVGTILISDSGDKLRYGTNETWVPYLLARGITATWGVTSEPFIDQYPIGNTILNHLWAGYTFGEAFWMGVPNTNWMAIAVGDPLYRPKFIGPMHAKGVTFNNGGTALQ